MSAHVASESVRCEMNKGVERYHFEKHSTSVSFQSSLTDDIRS